MNIGEKFFGERDQLFRMLFNLFNKPARMFFSSQVGDFRNPIIKRRVENFMSFNRLQTLGDDVFYLTYSQTNTTRTLTCDKIAFKIVSQQTVLLSTNYDQKF